MENEIRCMIIADGDDLRCWDDPNPVVKQAFEDRLAKLIGGYYTVDAQGRCVIDPQPWDRDLPFGHIAAATRGGETCVSTERNFGDVRVKVEVCKAHK